jgi:lipopolysaccharide heptosyltransferase I
MQPHHVRKGDGILLLRLGAVGDVIRTLPCLAALRRSFPDARLAWVVEAPSAGILPTGPLLDEIIIFPRKALGPEAFARNSARSFRDLGRFFSGLRGFRSDFSLDFQGSAKSSLIAWSSCTPLRIGFSSSGSREGSFFLNNLHVKPSSPRLNRVWKNLELLAPLGVFNGPLEFHYPAMETSTRISKFLSSLGPRVPIAIHPGTSPRQSHKRWPEARFAQVVRNLAEEGLCPIITWGPGEEAIVQNILSETGGAGLAAPSMTLPELRQLLSRCRLFIGGDTGPMHLAWTHQIPVVALFGSTDPSINGPLGDPHRILAPAWQVGRPRPRRGDPSPMLEITPADVLRAAREILEPALVPNSKAPLC